MGLMDGEVLSTEPQNHRSIKRPSFLHSAASSVVPMTCKCVTRAPCLSCKLKSNFPLYAPTGWTRRYLKLLVLKLNVFFSLELLFPLYWSLAPPN